MIILPDQQENKGALNQIVAVLRSFGNYLATAFDTSGRQRVNVETGSITASIASAQTLATVTTVTTMTNQTNIGGYAANEQIPALLTMNAISLRDRIVIS